MTRTTRTEIPGAQLASWRNALFGIFALCGVGLASLSARVPLLAASLDLSTAQVGQLLFGIAVGSIFGLTASGHLVAHFGTRVVIRWTLITGPAGLAFAAVSSGEVRSFALSFLALAIFGASVGACDVAMNVSGAANERALGRTIMPIYHAFFSFGTMGGAALGALAEFLSIPLSWHMCTLAAAMIVGSTIAVRFLLPETIAAPDRTSNTVPSAATGTQPDTSHPGPSDTWRARLSIWRDPRTLFIGLIVLGMAFAEGSASDWLSYAMVEGHGTDTATGAVVFGVFVTAMTAGRLAGVKLLDRFGRVPVLQGSAVLATVGLLLLILVPVVWIAIVGVVFWGLGAALGFPVGMSAAADDPRTAAARVSAVATIGYIAFLVGPPAIGFLGEEYGVLNGLLLVLALVAMAGLASPAAREPRSTPAEPTT